MRGTAGTATILETRRLTMQPAALPAGAGRCSDLLLLFHCLRFLPRFKLPPDHRDPVQPLRSLPDQPWRDCRSQAARACSQAYSLQPRPASSNISSISWQPLLELLSSRPPGDWQSTLTLPTWSRFNLELLLRPVIGFQCDPGGELRESLKLHPKSDTRMPHVVQGELKPLLTAAPSPPCRHFLCLAFLLAAAASAQNDLQNTLVACLGATGATVVLPNDPAYGAARQVRQRAGGWAGEAGGAAGWAHSRRSVLEAHL